MQYIESSGLNEPVGLFLNLIQSNEINAEQHTISIICLHQFNLGDQHTGFKICTFVAFWSRVGVLGVSRGSWNDQIVYSEYIHKELSWRARLMHRLLDVDDDQENRWK